MKAWRWILALVILATLAAWGWHWVAQDPGYVLVRFRGFTVETSLVVVILLILLGWVVFGLLWRVLRWPAGALSRRHRRMSQKRLVDGLIALTEGRYRDAERALRRASRRQVLRGPALLAAAQAAWRHGQDDRALEALNQAAQVAPRAARVLRARLLRRDGKPVQALALLAPDADHGKLSPNGWREWVLAALAQGDTHRALRALAPLKKSGAMSPRAYAALETKVLVASLQAASDGAMLNTLWSQWPKSQRCAPAVVGAYARKAASYGLVLAAKDEVESALRREWSPPLVETYGQLAGEHLEARLHCAEGWLDAHPHDASLLLALGCMSVRKASWAKAREYLERSLALAPSPSAWEGLGEAYSGMGDAALAQRCYRNALAVVRGDALEPLPEHAAMRGKLDTRSLAIEERNVHGMPQLKE